MHSIISAPLKRNPLHVQESTPRHLETPPLFDPYGIREARLLLRIHNVVSSDGDPGPLKTLLATLTSMIGKSGVGGTDLDVVVEHIMEQGKLDPKQIIQHLAYKVCSYSTRNIVFACNILSPE